MNAVLPERGRRRIRPSASASALLLALSLVAVLFAAPRYSGVGVAAQCVSTSPCSGRIYQNIGNCGGNAATNPCCPVGSPITAKTESCFPTEGGILPDNTTSPLLPYGVANGDVATFTQSGTTKGYTGDSITTWGGCDDCYWKWDLSTAGAGGQPVKLPFYGTTYNQIWINNNGVLSFTQGVSAYNGLKMPTSCCGPLIAVYWADVDTRTRPSGTVYTRIITDTPSLLNMTARTKVCFGTVKNFQAAYALVVTWDAVGTYSNNNALLNTFQIVIASDGAQSYIFFNYGWKAQQWGTGTASTVLPQVGFDAGDGVNYYNAVGTQTPAMYNMYNVTNANNGQPGRQCFKIDAATIGSPVALSNNANLTNLVANGGFVLSPLYSYFVNAYTMGVTNGWNLQLTPTFNNTDQSCTIQGQNVGDGVASPVMTITSTTTITVIVTAPDSTTTRTITISITIVPSTNARLTNLAITSYPFAEGTFDASGATCCYTRTLPSAVSSVTLTGTTSDTTATCMMGQLGPFGGTFSIPNVATTVGTSVYKFNCTAEDGINYRVYQITLTVTPSTDTSLATLTNNLGYPITTVTVNTTYAMAVLCTDGAVSITATSAYANAKVQINSDGYANGGRTDTVVLSSFGTTTATIQIQSESGTQTKSYSLQITRPYCSNANLTALTMATNLGYGMSLTPTFVRDTTAYTTTVASWTAGVVTTPTLSDATYATMTCNGVALGSAQTSGVVTLNTDGVNGAYTVVSVRVTAQDGTVKVYNVTVYKPPVPVLNIAAGGTVQGTCNSISVDVNRNEYQTVRLTYSGGELLQVMGTSNVTYGAPQMWMRLNALPNVGGVLVTDFASASSLAQITSVDNSSSMSLVWGTAPNANYYVTFTPSSVPATSAYRITLQACAYVAQNVSLFGPSQLSTVKLGQWNLFAAYPSSTQTVPAVQFRLSSSGPAFANPNDQYFYTYSKVSLNAPYPTPADAPTWFGGAVSAATNPVANSGTLSLYTSLTTLTSSVATGAGRVLFAVYAKPSGVIQTVSSGYPIVVNASVPAPVIVLAQPLTGPTVGGNVVTLQGTYFEPLTSVTLTNGQVTIGGVACTATSYDASGQLLCTVPAGSGTGLPLVVTLFGQTSPTFSLTYSYNPPTINANGVTWSNAPTSGNGTVTITGTNFGLSATATVGGQPCTVLSRTPQTQIICYAPAGDGSVSVLVFANGQSSSNSGTYTYDSPVLTASYAANTATTGGNPLTIWGRNFGTNTAVVQVTVGGTACAPTFWNHTMIVCTLAAGAGASQAIAVSIDGLQPSYPPSTALTFSYSAPVLVSISPNPVPVTTATLTVQGSGFASAAFAMSVSVLGGACTNILNRNDTYFTCTPPARSIGTPANPFVTVASQPSNALSGFGWAAPVLYAMTPTTVSVAGGDYVQISGLNLFGPDVSVTLVSTVLGGGGTVLITKNDTSLLWATPALSGGGVGFNLSVVITVGGQSSNPLFLNYTAPVLTAVTWTGSPNTQPCTDGLCTATLVGTSFGLSQAGVGGSVVLSTGATCAVTSWATASISCTYPSGTGTHQVRVIVGGRATAWYSVTYRAPTLTTLTPAAGVTTAGGDTLQIDGNNFGLTQGSSTVSVNLKQGVAACSPVISWTNYQIRCTTPAGNGTGLTATVTVSAQTGSIATYRYAAPTITAVTSGSGAFPTAGGISITVTGTSIDSFGNVTVGGVPCTPITSWTQSVSSSQVVCTLPAGGGTGRPVSLTTLNGLVTASTFPMSYDAPVIRGTAPATLTQVGQSVTLIGSNFGTQPVYSSVSVSGVSGTHTVTYANDTHMVFTLGGTPSTATVSITATYLSQSSAAFSPVSVAAPILTLLSPANGPTGPASSYNLTLTGLFFGDGVSRTTTVSVGSSSCPVVSLTGFNTLVCRMPAGVDAQQVQVVVGTQSSNKLTFQYDAPTVSQVKPNTNLPTGGGTISITVMGKSFGSSPTVTVGTATCTPQQSANDTVVVCTLPAGLGTNVAVSVRASSQTSNTDVTVSFSGPAITSVSPATGPTAGASNLVVTGTNFGPGGSSAGSVTVGGVDCPVQVASYTPTSITCTLPAGAGAGLVVVVTVSGAASNSYPFSYTAPVISSVVAQSTAVSQGGFTVLVSGSNFGPSAYPGAIAFNGTSSTFCSVIAGTWTSSSVSCLMPPGAGTVTLSLTTGVTPGAGGATAQTTATSAQFTYAPPTITSVTPANGPTIGSTLITVAGTNFYIDSTRVSVLVNSAVCTLSGTTPVTHTQITCLTPEGPGGAVSAQVTVFGQSVTSASAYTYDAASVTAVQAPSYATNALLGGVPAVPLLVLGNNFGSSAASVAIRVNGIVCGSVTLHNHTAVACNSIPAGTGTGLPVQVAINGAAYTAINTLFSYAAPQITQITSTGCPTVSGMTVVDCPILGAVNITLTGQYFGPIGSGATVSVGLTSGATPCTAVDYKGVAAGTTLVCTLPAGTSFNIPVTVTVGGQTSNSLLIAYAGPRLTTNTLVVNGQPGYGTGNIVMPDTNGTQTLHFAGTFLSPWYPANPTPLNLKFGTAGASSGAKEYTCTVTTYSNVFVECTLPASGALGSGLTFLYNDGVQWSPESVDTITFPKPAWVSGTIQSPGGSAGTHLPGSNSQGEFVQFSAQNVGSDASKLVVWYDVSGGAFTDATKQCVSVSVVTPFSSQTGVTVLQCRTQAGTGGPYVFKIKALNQWSSESTDTYSYPTSPIIYSLAGGAGSGCINNTLLNSTYDCNTVSGGLLTITGANFGTITSQNNVLVGVNSCPVQSATATTLTCTIPAGTGQNVPVTVFSNNRVSSPMALFSYAKPLVTSVSGCSDQPDGSTTNCARTGATKITITGKHFGPSGAFVFVGASRCTFPTVVTDSQLTCFTAAGTALSSPVLVIQASGTVSTTTGVLSYAQCLAAYYQANTTDYGCTSTSPGYYTDVSGLLAQKPCAPGSYSLGTASVCTSCNAGEFQTNTAATGCTQCGDGSYADQPGSASCQTCASGLFASGTGNIACTGCPAGTASSGISGNQSVACTNCTAGTYSGAAGSLCIQCQPGTYNDRSGLTACVSCQAGTYQISTGAATCTAADTGFIVASAGQVVQTACPAGAFSNVTGMSACLLCEAGMWVHKPSANTGATVCSTCATGTYIGVTGAADCLSCPKGTYANVQGMTACVSCSAGQIAASVGLTACTNCTSGSAATQAGLDSCTACASGQYAPATGASVCLDCALGMYNPSTGASTCIQCGVGSGGLGQVGPYTAQQTCVPCGSGTYQDQTGLTVCTACAKGSYAASPHATVCDTCLAGTFSASDGQAGCTDCPAGKFANTSATTCTSCAAGYWSAARSSACTACVAGQYAPAQNSVQCVTCSVGTFSNTTGASVCTSCSVGTVQPTTGMTACTECTTGAYAGSTAQVACSSCPVGAYAPQPGASTCTKCSAGTFAAQAGMSFCSNCTKGSANSVTGQGTCRSCDSGSFAGEDMDQLCTGCAPGSAAASTGSTTCAVCVAGTYSVGFNNRQCAQCAPGSFQSQSGQTFCAQCPEGSVATNAGQTACSSCTAGSIQPSAGQANCISCPVGQYAPNGNMTACLLCATGSFAAGVGSTGCTPCGSGAVSSAPGSGGCQACGIGRYQNATASLATCFNCPAGTAQPNPGRTFCSQCSTGSAQPNPGSGTCTACSAGTYADAMGYGACLDCPAGAYCPAGSINPQPCTLGSITAAPAQAVCLVCGSGRFSNTSLATTCTTCTAGSYAVSGGSVGATACTSCTPGTIAFTDGAAACDACPSGTFASGNGQSRCTDCTAGFYQPNPSRTGCVAADTGYYVSVSGSAVQNPCNAGTYAPNTNSSQCTSCDKGYVQVAQAMASCGACGTGKFMPSVGQAVCLECDAGKFANVSGLSACYSCGEGRYSQPDAFGNGASTCTQCAQGAYAATPGSASCSSCPPRTYSDALGLSACTTCPQGRAFSGTGATACTDCNPGEFAIGTNSLTCSPCALGTFSSTPRTVTCTSCAQGTFANVTGLSVCFDCPAGSSAFTPGAVQCALCGVGFFSNAAAQPNCTACDVGTYQSQQGQSYCTACEVGKSNGGTGQQTCADCTSGLFADVTGLALCKTCPSGTFAPSTGFSVCTNCGLGTTNPSYGQSTCVSCDKGTFMNATNSTASACTACPLGSFQSQGGMSACALCATGSSAGQTGLSACGQCTAGTFAEFSGSSTCTSCAFGKSQPLNSASTCDNCVAGRAASAPGASTCAPCARGFITVTDGLSVCSACDEGQYQDATAQSVCKECSAGSYQDSKRSTSCVECASGSFTNATGMTLCFSCEPGTSQPLSDKTSCDGCAAGRFTAQTNQAACTACALGRYTDVTGQTDCTDCGPGTYQGTLGQSSCVLCPNGTATNSYRQLACAPCGVGTYMDTDGNTTCAACPFGTAQPGIGSTSCIECGLGRYMATTGQVECLPCQAGRFANTTGLSECLQCAPGAYQIQTGKTECDLCTVGKYNQLPGLTFCTDCTAGTVTAVNGTITCTACDLGYYQPAPGQLQCVQCGKGLYQGTTSQTACVQCAPNSFGNTTGLSACYGCGLGRFMDQFSATACKDCGVGTYQWQTSQTACIACSVGTYTNVNGSTACTNCDRGSYQLLPGQTKCDPCPYGSETDATGQAVCVGCVPGSFANITGAGECYSCDRGQYQDQYAQSTCKACLFGTFTATGRQTTCALCGVGRYQPNNGTTVCVQCDKGTYQTSPGRSTCSACPTGTYMANPGASVCLSCASGSFANVTGLTECLKCTYGQFQAAGGQTTCAPCGTGSFQAQLGAASCTPCGSGTYGNVTGAQTCTPCEKGLAQPLTGQTTCAWCGIGSYSDRPGQPNCVSCSAGTFTPFNGSQSCAPCDRGYYQSVRGQTECVSCEAGKFSSQPAETSCSQCAPGSYTDQPARTVCAGCDAGYFTETYGRNSCDACPLGTFGTAPSQSACQQCAPGSYGNSTAIQVCAPCAAGAFQIDYGQTACDNCTIGTYAPSQSASVCLACAPGSYTDQNGTITCALCANATYNPLPGQTVCQDCPVGTAASAPGLLQCVDCAPGTWNNATRQSVCAQCSAGYYTSVYRSTACAYCLVSTYQDQSGQTACLLCQTGRYGVANASTDCTDCGVGTHQSQTGATECTDCALGKANRLTRQAECADCGVGKFGNITRATACYDCSSAQYQSLTGQQNCTWCEVGKYNTAPGMPACTLCPAGQFQNVTRATYCMDCDKGSFQSQLGETACSACASGSFTAQTGARTCSPCTAGSANPNTGQTACVDCDQGHYMDAFGASACAECSVGTFADVSGKTACSPCSLGDFEPHNGSIGCGTCGYGTYAGAPGSSACALCTAGTANTAHGASTCALCDAGSTTVAPGSWNCTACALGTAQPLPGQQNCTLCAPGTFSASTGLQQCTSCDLGRYANTTGRTECFVCQAGRYRRQQGGSACDACDVGTFQTGTGATVCTPCSEGYYANVTGLTECRQCAPGSAQAVQGKSTCDECAPGSFALTSGRSTCTSCDAGTYMPRNGSALECDPCPQATYNFNTGQSVCQDCPEGTANPGSRAAECPACPAGRFNNVTGVVECSPCPQGSYQINTGQTKCELCGRGDVAPVTGMAECLSCASGKYNAQTGQSACTDCDAGHEQPLTGKSTCTSCTIPRFSNVAGQAQCALCPAGTFGNHTGQVACNPCPAGSHQSLYGQSVCEPCPAGFSTNGATSLPECLFCPDGQANANTGAASCTVCSQLSQPSFDRRKCECNAGYYQPYYVDRSNDFVCVHCPTGADCSVSGRTWLNLPALSGWWRPTNVSLNFYRCPLPSYCVGGNAAASALSETSGSGCAENREGIMCSHCKEGYETATVGAGCVPCPDSAASSGSAILLGIVFLVLLVLQFWYMLKSGDALMRRVVNVDKAKRKGEEENEDMVRRDIFGEEMGPAGGDDAVDAPADKKKAAKSKADEDDDDDDDETLGASPQLKPDDLKAAEQDDDGDDQDDSSEGEASADDLNNPNLDDQERAERKAERAALRAARKQKRRKLAVRAPRSSPFGSPEEPKPDFTYKLKIFLGFLQIVTNLGTGLQIQWPPSFKEFVQAFDVANFQNIVNQATSVECVASYSYYVQYVVIVLSPIAVTFLVFVFYLFPRYAGCGPCRFISPQQQERSTMRFWRLTLYVVFLIYPGVSSTVLRHYICVDIDSTPYLYADLRVQCYTQTWNLFALVSIALVLLYPLGIPMFFYSVLRVNRARLKENRTKVQLGFLYAGYHLKVWWFEMLDMLHKLIVTSMLALFPTGAQLPVGMFVVVLYAIVILVVHPYIRAEDDQLHLFCQIEVLMLLIVGYVFYSLPANESYSSFDDTVISIALLVICAFFIGLCLYYAGHTVYDMTKTWWRARKARKAKAEADAKNPAPAPENAAGAGAAAGGAAGAAGGAADGKDGDDSSSDGEKKGAEQSMSRSASKSSKSKSKSAKPNAGGSGDEQPAAPMPGVMSSAPNSPAPPLPTSP